MTAFRSAITRDPRRLLDEEIVNLAIGYFTARARAGEAVAFTHQRRYAGEHVCVIRRQLLPSCSPAYTMYR